MTTTFLGVSYWELLDTLNTERIARKRSLSGEKLSYFEHAEFKGLVGHPQTDVQQVAGIQSENGTGNTFLEVVSFSVIKEVVNMNVNVAVKGEKKWERRKEETAQYSNLENICSERMKEGK